jgi:ubiquitin-protein ligase
MASGNPAHARIKKELKEVQSSDKSGLGADLVNDDIAHWKGYFTG